MVKRSSLKVLIICSGNADYISHFILEQVNSLVVQGVIAEYFLIRGKGILGYLRNYKSLIEKIKSFTPNIIHAHYGLSGLFAVLQKKVPVVITFHGSDINKRTVRPFSRLASRLSIANIFVSKKMMQMMTVPNSYYIPCGVNLEVFKPLIQQEARAEMGLRKDIKYILFSSSFKNLVKNYPLAESAINLLDNLNIKLFELKGYSRKEVVILMNAVDLALMTSISEGSPQFIKEAMACNLPIVSTDVGDVKEVIAETEGCFISNFKPKEVANEINKAINFSKRTNGSEKINHFDNKKIAKKILKLYYKKLKI